MAEDCALLPFHARMAMQVERHATQSLYIIPTTPDVILSRPSADEGGQNLPRKESPVMEKNDE